MTTFDDIYGNALDHRDLAEQLGVLLEKAIFEKRLFQEVVSWFRGRNRYLNKIILPALDELNKMERKKKKSIENLQEAKASLPEILNLVADHRYEEAQKKFDLKIGEPFDLDTHLIDYRYDIDAYLKDLEEDIEDLLKQAVEDIETYRDQKEDIEILKESLSKLTSSKEINTWKLFHEVDDFNQIKNELEIDLPDIPELPNYMSISENRIRTVHSEIRALISEMDSLYPMKLFETQKRCLRKIIHDVGNERGRKAFENRRNELITSTNFSVTQFNFKYWQITGKRWERVSTNAHGYRSVKATHQPIKEI